MDAGWGIVAGGAAIAIAAMAFLVLVKLRRPAALSRPSPADALLPLAFAMVALGIAFGGDRVAGYTFIGVGVLLAVAASYFRWRAG
ncbi:MAG: hypothetical protein AB7L91_03010 [Dehalococcoidia bacterium]